MTTKEKQLSSLYASLRREVGSSTLDIVNKIVELELELEQECNQ